MQTQHPGLRHVGRWLLSAALAAGLLVGPWAAQPVAATPPAVVLGGTFEVNTNTDVYAYDSLLTLREALEAANGDYVGPFTEDERFQLFGCTFNITGTITGGCGPGFADEIGFKTGVGLTLVLNPAKGALPLVDDTAPTTIDASFNGPFTLDASNAGGSQNGLNILSDNNTVRGLTIINSPRDGYTILGSHNTLTDGAGARANGRNGVTISGGAFNIIEAAAIGVAGAANCGAGNAQNGVGLEALAHDNLLQFNVISCNGLNGVLLTNVTTNTLTSNLIGTDPTGLLDRGNLANGVVITAGAQANTIGATTAERNVISGNGLAGVLIGGGAHANTVTGNNIGSDLPGTAALPNAMGVVINSGAYLNQVGLEDVTFTHVNSINGNSGAGVQLSGSGTYSNSVTFNDIGYTDAGAVPNGGNGIELLAGTHGNTIGPTNRIIANGGSGILVAGGSTANRLSGTSGYVNITGLNLIHRNQAYGVLFDGASGNVLTYAYMWDNGLDGVAERNGAGANTWSLMFLGSNGGLGIDRDAAGDQTNTISGPLPVITSTVISGLTLTVRGTVPNVPLAGDMVELYVAYPEDRDPSGYGEGQSLLVTSTIAANGTWMIQLPVAYSGGGCLLTAIYTYATGPSTQQSSEMAHNSGLCRLYLPLAVKP